MMNQKFNPFKYNPSKFSPSDNKKEKNKNIFYDTPAERE